MSLEAETNSENVKAAKKAQNPQFLQTHLYLDQDQRVMVAGYSVAGDSFRVESSRPWASARAVIRARGLVGFAGRAFDVHPDGERLIGAWMPESAAMPVQNTVVLAFNFFEELSRLAPPKR